MAEGIAIESTARNFLLTAVSTFFGRFSSGEFELYNEFSLQHELGNFLRTSLASMKVQFERNVSHFGVAKEHFVKREIDICAFDNSTLLYAIELKYPKRGQYPEQIYSFCKDVLFAEQLKMSGFVQTAAIFLADDQNFFRPAVGDGKIYDYFRSNLPLEGRISKPTGGADEFIQLYSRHLIQWNTLQNGYAYAIVMP